MKREYVNPNLFNYTGRGNAENRIKELKLHLKADRLSCTRFKVDELRLLLYTFTFVLLWRLRRGLAGKELAAATVDTIKLKLLKIGARVVRSMRRVHFAMPRTYSYQRLFAFALANIQNILLRCRPDGLPGAWRPRSTAKSEHCRCAQMSGYSA